MRACRAAPFRGAEPCGRFSGAAGRRAGRRRSSRGPLCLPKAGTGPRERRGPWPRRRRASASERVPPGAQPWIPTTKCVGMTAGRGMASPRRRPRPAARAAGLWPKRGRPSPEPRQRRGASVAARSAAPRGAGQGRPRSGGAMGAAYRGHEASASGGGKGGPGYGGKWTQGGSWAAHGGKTAAGGRGKHNADKGGLIERGLYDRQLGIEQLKQGPPPKTFRG